MHHVEVNACGQHCDTHGLHITMTRVSCALSWNTCGDIAAVSATGMLDTTAHCRSTACQAGALVTSFHNQLSIPCLTIARHRVPLSTPSCIAPLPARTITPSPSRRHAVTPSRRHARVSAGVPRRPPAALRAWQRASGGPGREQRGGLRGDRVGRRPEQAGGGHGEAPPRHHGCSDVEGEGRPRRWEWLIQEPADYAMCALVTSGW